MLVKELLSLHPFINNASLLAGRGGLESRITDITIMEAPDFYNWVNGGEFVLSTFYSIKDDIEQQVNVIRQLSKNKIAALGIKIGRFLQQIDPLVIKTANDCNLPLFSIRKETKFRDLIRVVSEKLINTSNDYSQDIIEFNELINRLVVNGEPPEKLCQEITDYIGYPCAIFSLTREKLAGKVMIGQHNQATEEIIINNILDEFILNSKHINIHSKEYRKGSLIIFGCSIRGELIKILIFSNVNKWGNYESILARIAANGIGSRFLEEHIQQNVEERMISSFVDDVIFKEFDHETFYNRAKFFGWELYDRFQAVVVQLVDEAEITEEAFQLLADRWDYQMRKTFPSVLTVAKKDELITLLSIPTNSPFNNHNFHKEKIKDVLSILFYRSPLESKVRIGIGSLFEDPQKLKVSYRQAHSLVRIGKGKEERLWYSSDHLLELLLMQTRNITEYQLIKEATVIPLNEYDKKNGTELIKSVKAVVESDSLERAAEKLYIHINTLRNRMKKVAEITGVDPLTTLGKMMFVTVLIDMTN